MGEVVVMGFDRAQALHDIVMAQDRLAQARTALDAVRAALEKLPVPPVPVAPAPPTPPPPAPSPAAAAPSLRPLAWGRKVSPELRKRVILTGADFEFEPNWLMACMAFETMETFRADIRPRRRDGTLVSSAVGLIQFLESTAKQLGTSTAALAAMTVEKQFDYVWLYFRNSIKTFGPVRTLEDCYMHIHWPKAVGKPNESTMYVKGTSAYAANAGLDLDKNHVITKAEAGSLVREKLRRGLLPENVA